MSLFSSIFGSKKAAKDSTEDAMKQLSETIDIITKKSEFIESKIDKLTNEARVLAKKDRTKALKCLKEKKVLQKQLDRYDASLTTLENQMHNLDSSKLNVATLEALKNANKAIKNSHGNMKIDDIYKIREDMEEQEEMAKEISDIITMPSSTDGIDRDELEDELNALCAEGEEDALDELLDVRAPSSKFESKKAPSKAKNEEEEELDDLMAFTR